MSMYGDSNQQKNDMLYEMETFLEDHPVSELIEVVADAIAHKEWNEQE